jgi:hypothetical protein
MMFRQLTGVSRYKATQTTKYTVLSSAVWRNVKVSDIELHLGFKQLKDTISVSLSSNNILSDLIHRRLMSAANTAR